MGYLPQHKFGICHCDNCKGAEVAGRKVGKTFYCLRSYNNMKTKEQIDKAKDRNKVRMLSVGMADKSTYTKPVDNKLVDNAAVKRLDKLNIFFAECAIEIAKNPSCMNCGEKLSFGLYDNSNEALVKAQLRDFRNATAHILPKGIFHSVETHPLIWLPLGAKCGCHHDTHRLDKFSKMRIFPEAVRRFRIFQPLITEKHKLLDEFIKYADQILL
jgi:hypothetical protein